MTVEAKGKTVSIFCVRISERVAINIAVSPGQETVRFQNAFPDAIPHGSIWMSQDPVAEVCRQRASHAPGYFQESEVMAMTPEQIEQIAADIELEIAASLEDALCDNRLNADHYVKDNRAVLGNIVRNAIAAALKPTD